jgi:hypothetical protein
MPMRVQDRDSATTPIKSAEMLTKSKIVEANQSPQLSSSSQSSSYENDKPLLIVRKRVVNECDGHAKKGSERATADVMQYRIPLSVLIVTYLSYLTIIIIGHLRDLLGKLFWPKQFAHLRVQNVCTHD